MADNKFLAFLAPMLAFFTVACAPVEDDVQGDTSPTQVEDTGVAVQWPGSEETGQLEETGTQPARDICSNPLRNVFETITLDTPPEGIFTNALLREINNAANGNWEKTFDSETKGLVLRTAGQLDDVLLWSSPGPMTWYRNIRCGFEPVVIDDQRNVWAATLVDTNGDGDLDIVAVYIPMIPEQQALDIVVAMQNSGEGESIDVGMPGPRLGIFERVGDNFVYTRDIDAELPPAIQIQGIAARDVSGPGFEPDGLPDLIIQGGTTGRQPLLIGDGEGGFAAPSSRSYDSVYANGGLTVWFDEDRTRYETWHSYDEANAPSQLAIVTRGVQRFDNLFDEGVSDMGGALADFGLNQGLDLVTTDNGCFRVGTLAGSSFLHREFPVGCQESSRRSVGLAHFWSPVALDFDGDGDMDVALGAGTEHVTEPKPDTFRLMENVTSPGGELEFVLRDDLVRTSLPSYDGRGVLRGNFSGNGPNDLVMFGIRTGGVKSVDSPPVLLVNGFDAATLRIYLENFQGQPAEASVRAYRKDGTSYWISAAGSSSGVAQEGPGYINLTQASEIKKVVIWWASGSPRQTTLVEEDLTQMATQKALRSSQATVRQSP